MRYVSPDGLEWTQTLEWLEFWPEETEEWCALRVGVDGGRFWLRREGQPWLGYLLPGGATAWDVTYAEGRLVAVGDRGSVWVSTPLILLETPCASRDAQGKLHWNLAVYGPPGTGYELQTSGGSGDLDFRWHRGGHGRTN